MDVTAPAPTTSAAQPASTTTTTGSATAITADFETFLTMLTVQMENQDPLNPIASEDLAVQLATFSGVEQQVLTNQLLDGIAQELGTSGLSELASWIGMDVRTAASTAFDGAPLSLHAEVAAGADSAVLVVRDETGSVVQRLAIPPQSGELAWAGVDESGQPLAAGSYSFEVESYNGEELIGVTGAEAYQRVVEARLEDSGVVLVLEGGSTVSPEAVSAIRAPQAG